MNVLACDTSTAILHLALCIFDDQQNISWFESISLTAGNRHSELLMDRIISLCADASIEVSDLDLLVAAKGPGSFTGLRIAMATLKGISCAANIPLVGVMSLDAWYHAIDFADRPTLVVIDAKKQRFYSALYERGERLVGPADLRLEQIKELIDHYPTLLVSGSDAPLLAKRLDKNLTIAHGEGSALALSLARLGVKQYLSQGVDSDEAGPLYIRVSDAELALLKRTQSLEERDD